MRYIAITIVLVLGLTGCSMHKKMYQSGPTTIKVRFDKKGNEYELETDENWFGGSYTKEKKESYTANSNLELNFYTYDAEEADIHAILSYSGMGEVFTTDESRLIIGNEDQQVVLDGRIYSSSEMVTKNSYGQIVSRSGHFLHIVTFDFGFETLKEIAALSDKKVLRAGNRSPTQWFLNQRNVDVLNEFIEIVEEKKYLN